MTRPAHDSGKMPHQSGKWPRFRGSHPRTEKDMSTLLGSLVAIVTPMKEDGELDLDAFRRLIDWHIAEGTDGIVVVGTTGESPTVDFDEHHLLIRTAVDHVAKRSVSRSSQAPERIPRAKRSSWPRMPSSRART
jgi:hypothetical protein